MKKQYKHMYYLKNQDVEIVRQAVMFINMVDKLSLNQKYIVLIGESAVDIFLYLSRICRLNYKVLLIDLSSSGIIFDIISPYGQQIEHNIFFSYGLSDKLEKQCDIVIIFTNDFSYIPKRYYSCDMYFFISSKKYHLIRLSKSISCLKDVSNVLLVLRNSKEEKKDVIIKLHLSGIPHDVINRTVFIKDTDNDNSVFRLMEYNSVFIYKNLSEDLKRLLSYMYKKITSTSSCFDEVGFKWVM